MFDICHVFSNSLFEGKTQGIIAVRTSFNLISWSDYNVVNTGGSAGSSTGSAECPFVVFLNGYYYLFRTSCYRPAKNHVYRSRNPMDFGLDTDDRKVTTLTAAAPEIIQIGKQFYISTVEDLEDGIKVAKLGWDPPLE